MKPSYEELEQMLEECRREFRSADITMQNLEAKCEKMAAELSVVLTDRAVILEDFDNTCFEIGMQRGEKYEAYPTPMVANHEAFLAEVRASAIDSIVDIKTKQLTDMHPDTHAFGATATSIRSQINEMQVFAANIRKGVQS